MLCLNDIDQLESSILVSDLNSQSQCRDFTEITG